VMWRLAKRLPPHRRPALAGIRHQLRRGDVVRTACPAAAFGDRGTGADGVGAPGGELAEGCGGWPWRGVLSAAGAASGAPSVPGRGQGRRLAAPSALEQGPWPGRRLGAGGVVWASHRCAPFSWGRWRAVPGSGAALAA